MLRVDLNPTHAALRRALTGDEGAREELLARLRPRIVLWAASRMSSALRGKLEPEDVAQEVLLALHRDLDGFEEREGVGFLSWVFRIAENRVRDAAARFAAKKRQAEPLPARTGTSPSQAFARQEAADRLLTVVARLPEDYRTVIRLRRLEERGDVEVARLMDRSEIAVRVLYCRALKALRSEMLDSSRNGFAPIPLSPPEGT